MPDRRGLAIGLTVWLGELVVGLAPLMCQSLLHSFLAITVRPALCKATELDQFMDCHWVRNGLEQDAEFCIVAVVIAGLALLPIPRMRIVALWEWRHFYLYVCSLGLGLLMVAAAMLFALINAGVSHDTEAMVRVVLVAAVLGSFMVAVVRAVEQ